MDNYVGNNMMNYGVANSSQQNHGSIESGRNESTPFTQSRALDPTATNQLRIPISERMVHNQSANIRISSSSSTLTDLLRDNQVHNDASETGLYHYEWKRFQTFGEKQGSRYKHDQISGLRLARMGFYYNSTEDSVKCYKCNFVLKPSDLSSFVDDLKPLITEHKKAEPSCEMVQCEEAESRVSASSNITLTTRNSSMSAGFSAHPESSELTRSGRRATSNANGLLANGIGNNLAGDLNSLQLTEASNASAHNTSQAAGNEREVTAEVTNNLPRDADKMATGAMSNNGLPPGNQKNTPPSTEAVEDVVVQNPKHSDYKQPDARKNSFSFGWPDYLDQTPKVMAEAGFFYVGVADFTRCFCCGGGLRNWEPGDNPVLEHARWFPKCEYINKSKGERFVAAVQRRHQEHMAEQQRQQAELAQRRDENRNPPDPMTTEAADVMQEMGYSVERTKAAILATRKQTGHSVVTIQQVLTWLLNEEERQAGIRMGLSTRRPDENNTRQSTPHNNGGGSVTSNNSRSSSEPSGHMPATSSTVPTTTEPKGRDKFDVETLKRENEKLKEMRPECAICMEVPPNVTLLPCGHLVCCENCCARLTLCPICRTEIKDVVKIR